MHWTQRPQLAHRPPPPRGGGGGCGKLCVYVWGSRSCPAGAGSSAHGQKRLCRLRGSIGLLNDELRFLAMSLSPQCTPGPFCCMQVSCNDWSVSHEVTSAYLLEKLVSSHSALLLEPGFPLDGADSWVGSSYFASEPWTWNAKLAASVNGQQPKDFIAHRPWADQMQVQSGLPAESMQHPPFPFPFPLSVGSSQRTSSPTAPGQTRCRYSLGCLQKACSTLLSLSRSLCQRAAAKGLHRPPPLGRTDAGTVWAACRKHASPSFPFPVPSTNVLGQSSILPKVHGPFRCSPEVLNLCKLDALSNPSCCRGLQGLIHPASWLEEVGLRLHRMWKGCSFTAPQLMLHFNEPSDVCRALSCSKDVAACRGHPEMAL